MRKLFKVDTIENIGDNWLIADFGIEPENNIHYILTTDRVHASEVWMLGSVKDLVELVCKLLNEYHNQNAFCVSCAGKVYCEGCEE